MYLTMLDYAGLQLSLMTMSKVLWSHIESKLTIHSFEKPIVRPDKLLSAFEPLNNVIRIIGKLLTRPDKIKC